MGLEKKVILSETTRPQKTNVVCIHLHVDIVSPSEKGLCPQNTLMAPTPPDSGDQPPPYRVKSPSSGLEIPPILTLEIPTLESSTPSKDPYKSPHFLLRSLLLLA